jgi:cobalt-precorrin 5A hydrolase
VLGPEVSRVVLGLGMASSARRDEVRDLALDVLARAGVDLGDVALVATRHRFVDDDRARLGPPVVAIDDDALVTGYPARRTSTSTGSGHHFPARVAEGCALAAAGPGAELLVGTTRSAHATAAVAVAPRRTDARP